LGVPPSNTRLWACPVLWSPFPSEFFISEPFGLAIFELPLRSLTSAADVLFLPRLAQTLCGVFCVPLCGELLGIRRAPTHWRFFRDSFELRSRPPLLTTCSNVYPPETRLFWLSPGSFLFIPPFHFLGSNTQTFFRHFFFSFVVRLRPFCVPGFCPFPRDHHRSFFVRLFR